MIFVERNLLLVPADLVRVRVEGGEAEVAADDVGEQHAERLRRTASSPDRTCVVQLDVGGAVAPLADVDLREPLERSDEDPLGQDREADPQSRLYPGGRRIPPSRVARDPARDGEGDLFAGKGRGESADLGRDPLDSEVGEELLDAHRHVLRARDLGSDLGVKPDVPGLFRDRVGAVDLGLDRPKI